MKTLVTVSTMMLFAFAASAQGEAGTNVVYSPNPPLMVIKNNRITYPAGGPYVDAHGVTRLCGSQLVMDQPNGGAGGGVRTACADKPALSADDFSQMAPAAGGSRSLSDRNLPSDSKTSLRTDRETIPAQ